jgi:O-antigen ligase
VVGTGYESFWLGNRLEEVQSITGQDTNEAHNGYIEMYINLGWVGVTLLALLIVVGYFNAIRIYSRDPDAGSLRLAFFLATIISAFTEAAFRMMDPKWTFFLLATAALPANSAPDDDGRGGLAEYGLDLSQEAGAGIYEEALER